MGVRVRRVVLGLVSAKREMREEEEGLLWSCGEFKIKVKV